MVRGLPQNAVKVHTAYLPCWRREGRTWPRSLNFILFVPLSSTLFQERKLICQILTFTKGNEEYTTAHWPWSHHGCRIESPLTSKTILAQVSTSKVMAYVVSSPHAAELQIVVLKYHIRTRPCLQTLHKSARAKTSSDQDPCLPLPLPNQRLNIPSSALDFLSPIKLHPTSRCLYVASSSVCLSISSVEDGGSTTD